MAKTTVSWKGEVVSVDQYDNPTVTQANQAFAFKLSQFSNDVDAYEIGDEVNLTATQGKDGTYWIDTLQNLTQDRGKRPPVVKRNGNFRKPISSPGQIMQAVVPSQAPINSVAPASTPLPDNQARVLKSLEIAFNYLQGDSDADETDAFALAEKIIQWAAQRGA
jgi:hypothetical protein